MAGITLAQAIQSFERETGCVGDRELVLDDIAEAIEFVLLSGGGDLLREWKLPIHAGRVTLPRDLETPVKYKAGDSANGGYGIFATPYLSYSSSGVLTCDGYRNWHAQLEMKCRKVATQFRLPPGGLRLVLTTRNKSDVGKCAQISGKRGGMDIAPMHHGRRTTGEHLKIYHEDDPEKNYSAFVFDEITNVVKDMTNDYVMLSGVDPQTNTPYFLSHYHPDEEVPQYTEVEMFRCNTWESPRDADSWLHVLGRINPSIRYLRGEEVIPVTSLQMLKLLAKRAKYDAQNDFESALLMEQRIVRIIKKQRHYQQAPGKTMSRTMAGSGGTLTNI